MQEQESHIVPGQTRSRAAWAHVIPFVLWLFVMHMLGDPAGWKYAVRTALCAGAFLWLRPWAGYPGLKIRNLPLAFAVGLLVFVAWVGMETAWMGARFPAWQDAYVRYAVLPWGRPREDPLGAAYAPETAGWAMMGMRLFGSAVVIAVIEEFFWRGFLYRWMQGRDFRAVDPGRFDAISFFLVAAVFGVEHREWLAGFVAGLAYGAMYLKTRDIWATAVAHGVTNYVLGLYVVSTGSYAFW